MMASRHDPYPSAWTGRRSRTIRTTPPIMRRRPRGGARMLDNPDPEGCAPPTAVSVASPIWAGSLWPSVR